jgi:hypothetical protein
MLKVRGGRFEATKGNIGRLEYWKDGMLVKRERIKVLCPCFVIPIIPFFQYSKILSFILAPVS